MSTDNFTTLEEIDMITSDWEEQESCEALAKLIAHGKNLKKVDIDWQVGNERIEVNYTNKLVKITREESGEQVCSTERTNQQQIRI